MTTNNVTERHRRPWGGARYPPNASKYESKNDALYHGYAYKEAGRIRDFEVLHVTVLRTAGGSAGTGGRALRLPGAA
jgi:hypothetical protein